MRNWEWLFILFLILAVALPARAGVVADFFDDGFNASSMGSAGACLTKGAKTDSIFLNPAQILRYNNEIFEFSQNSKFGGDVKEYSGAFIVPIKSKYAIGLAFPYSKIDGIQITQEDLVTNEGVVVGSFSDSRYGICVSAAAKLRSNILLGTTMKYFSHRINNNSGSSVGFDLGLIYSLKNIDIAFVMHNIGGMKIKYNNGTEDEIKMRYKLGVSCQIKEKISLEFVKEFGELQVSTFRVGGEFQLNKNLSIKSGFAKKGSNYNITTGIGIDYSKFIFDYAYLNDAEGLGDTHRFTLGIKL